MGSVYLPGTQRPGLDGTPPPPPATWPATLEPSVFGAGRCFRGGQFDAEYHFLINPRLFLE